MASRQPQPVNTFKRLVRALSRPDLTRSKSDINLRSSKDSWENEKQDDWVPPLPSAQLSVPHSYFPVPPRDVLLDGEANGTERHIESVGAKAYDVAESVAAAPGVPFAPRSPNDPGPLRPNSELESWNLPRKPSRPSLRRARSSKGSQKSSTKSPPRSNDGHEGITGLSFREKGGYSARRPDSVSIYSTKSTKSSLGRAASTLRHAVSKTFEPIQKEEGEKRVLVLVADGTEELSLMTVYDCLGRASLSPVLVSVSPEFSPSHSLPYITLSRGAKILADVKFEKLDDAQKASFDAVIIPGGTKGVERLSKNEGVKKLLREFFVEDKLVGCIGAGSIVPLSAGIGFGLSITSDHSSRDELEKDYLYSEDRVVVSENLVTSRSAATAMEWALTLVEVLAGFETRDEVSLELGI